MKLDADFVERRLLPLLVAFGLGVVMTTAAGDRARERQTTVRVSDNTIIGIECVPEVAGAPVWIVPEVRP